MPSRPSAKWWPPTRKNRSPTWTWGTALLQLGDVGGALDKYRESLRLSPGNPRLHYNLGLVYTLQKSYPKALEHYQNAVELDPEFENAHFNAANLLMRLGNMAQAGQHYGRVNELNPSHAFAQFMQAMTLVKLGRYQGRANASGDQPQGSARGYRYHPCPGSPAGSFAPKHGQRRTHGSEAPGGCLPIAK